MARDNFTQATKEIIAKRVSFRCSFPDCPLTATTGPHSESMKAVNIGVAAHIAGASLAGPRYDPDMTADQRQSAENGIWLCQNHAKLIDNDIDTYTVETLRYWKVLAEKQAKQQIEKPHVEGTEQSAVFTKLERLMPDLFREMRLDLHQKPLRREVVLVPKEGYWAKGTEFLYYFEDHSDLEGKFQILENEGFVRDITHNSVKRYQLSENLVIFLEISALQQVTASNAETSRRLDFKIDQLKVFIREGHELGMQGYQPIRRMSPDATFHARVERFLTEYFDQEHVDRFKEKHIQALEEILSELLK